MDSMVLYLIKLSLFNTILFFVIVWVCRLFSPYISQKQQYYLQLVPVLGFLIPFYKAAEPFSAHLASENAYVVSEALPPYFAEPVMGGETAAAGGGPFLFYLWIAGGLIMIAYKLTRYIKCRKIIGRNLSKVLDKQKLQVYETVCGELGLKRGPALYVCPYLSTPVFTSMGGFKIILPESGPADSQSLRLVFYHELVHFVRKDIWYRRLLMLISVVHWFNPLMPFINRTNSRCCELSCDEQVLRRLNHRKKTEYGDLILNTCKQNVALQSQFLLFSGSRKLMKERLMLIAGRKSENMKLKRVCPKIVSVILLIVFSAMSLMSCGTEAKAQTTSVKNTATAVQKKQTTNIRTVTGKDGKKYTEVVIPIKGIDTIDAVFTQPELKGREVEMLYFGSKNYHRIEGILERVHQCPDTKIKDGEFILEGPSDIVKPEQIEDKGMVVLTLAEQVD